MHILDYKFDALYEPYLSRSSPSTHSRSPGLPGCASLISSAPGSNENQYCEFFPRTVLARAEGKTSRANARISAELRPPTGMGRRFHFPLLRRLRRPMEATNG